MERVAVLERRGGREGWWKRLRSRYVSYPPPPFSVTYRDALGLHYTRNYLSMCSVAFFFSFLFEVAAFKLHGLAGERRRPFSGFIAVRGNVGIIRVQVVQQLRCVIMVKGETDSFLGIPWILCIINVGMSTQFCNTYIYILSVLSKLKISLDRERIWWKEL